MCPNFSLDASQSTFLWFLVAKRKNADILALQCSRFSSSVFSCFTVLMYCQRVDAHLSLSNFYFLFLVFEASDIIGPCAVKIQCKSFTEASFMVIASWRDDFSGEKSIHSDPLHPYKCLWN